MDILGAREISPFVAVRGGYATAVASEQIGTRHRGGAMFDASAGMRVYLKANPDALSIEPLRFFQLNPYALSFEPQKHFEMSLGCYFHNEKYKNNQVSTFFFFFLVRAINLKIP